jgi:N-acyl-D-aspartate/D-glutamate deacylase
MPVEQGVHKVTGELADFLGLVDAIAVGRPADVVVFDLDELDPGPCGAWPTSPPAPIASPRAPSDCGTSW